MTDPVPSKDLLPCPFCGKEAKVYGVNLVGCVDTVGCGAQVDWGHFYGPDPVIAAWNKRTASAPEPRADLQAAAFDLIDVLDAALIGAPDTGLRVRPENYLPVLAAIKRVKSITEAASSQPSRDGQA